MAKKKKIKLLDNIINDVAEKPKVGRPRKWEITKEGNQKLIDDIQAYFDNTNPPYEVSSLCAYIGCTRETLCQYEKNPVFKDTIKMAKQIIESDLIKRGLNGYNDKTITIFVLKNGFGYEDHYSQDIKTEQKIITGLSKEQIAEILADDE